MTPFAAVRRVMGVVIASVMVVGRLAATKCGAPHQLRLAWSIALWQAALGFLFFAVDWTDARAARTVAESAASSIRERDPTGKIWFAGHWGFQFYGERAGMFPVVSKDGRLSARPGDWLVIPEHSYEQQKLHWQPGQVEAMFDVVLDDWLPFRTVRCFYGTHSGAPLEQKIGPRLTATVYRVKS
jgi:hypothetical protein